MSLERYLGLGKLELLRREVESSTSILLKIMFYWLINKNCLKEQQDKDIKQRSAIVITVSNKIKAKWVITNGLWFREAIKKMKKYWDVRLGSISMKCCRIVHERQGSYRDRPKNA